MPSGSKKRKAAKKKKENQQSGDNNPSSAHALSLGGDDVKHQDDKESDVGEVSSSASQDHHSQHNILTEGEEEEIEKGTVLDLPSAEGAKIEVSNGHSIVVEGTVVPVEREFKIEDEYEKKNGRFEHDEPARKSYDGGSSGSYSSSSCSSDDESHGIKCSQAVVDITPVVDSVKAADTSSEEHAEAIESTITEQVIDPIVENIVVSEKISSLGEETELVVSSPPNNCGAPSIIEYVFKENGEKKHSSIEDQVGVSEAFKDATSQREEAIFPTVENITQETDDWLNLSYNAPEAAADKGGDTDKDLGVIEQLLVPTPHPVQTTSWKSCCGLFEVFTGSGR